MTQTARFQLARGIGLGGLLLVAAGLWSGWNQEPAPPVGPWLTVAPGSRWLDGLGRDEVRIIEFRVENRNRSGPARIIGSDDFCNPQRCLSSIGLPVTIPPGGEATIKAELKVTQPGPFAFDFMLYSDAPGQIELPVHLTGSIDEPS